MKPKNEEKITIESLYALLDKGERDAQKRSEEFNRDLKESSEKFDRDLKKSEEKFNRDLKKSEEKFNREWQKIKELQEETARQMEKTDEKLREMGINVGGIGNSNGDVAEEYFINAFKEKPMLNGETYDVIKPNLRPLAEERQKRNEYNDEYDIYLENDKSTAIIEIKYNVENSDINSLLEKGRNFRNYLPSYANHKLYLGIASLSFRKTDEDAILKEGIAVIKQESDKMVINTEYLKEF